MYVSDEDELYRREGQAYGAFVESVHAAVATVPWGKVATYGQIAAMAGDPDAAREVGHIMSAVSAGLGLPCHRIVNRAGTLSPEYAFGGQERQRAMLEAEGITFSAKGRINMDRHVWGEDEQLSLL